MNQPQTTLEDGYNVVFERDESEYVATVPSLNYLSARGETLDEARDNIRDHLALYLQTSSSTSNTSP